MFVTVHHQIRDPKQWAEHTQHITTTIEQGRLPKGLKGLMYLPSAEGHQAVCLWETDTLDNLKSYLDRETGAAAKNEYFRVDERAAVGLPRAERPLTDSEKRVEEAMLMAA